MKLHPVAILIVSAMILFTPSLVSQFPSSRVTSDATLTAHGLPIPPMPSGLFVPPSTFVRSVLVTNVRPVVVEVTVVSNNEYVIVWYAAGKPNTNVVILSSNIVSVATNSL